MHNREYIRARTIGMIDGKAHGSCALVRRDESITHRLQNGPDAGLDGTDKGKLDGVRILTRLQCTRVCTLVELVQCSYTAVAVLLGIASLIL